MPDLPLETNVIVATKVLSKHQETPWPRQSQNKDLFLVGLCWLLPLQGVAGGAEFSGWLAAVISAAREDQQEDNWV